MMGRTYNSVLKTTDGKEQWLDAWDMFETHSTHVKWTWRGKGSLIVPWHVIRAIAHENLPAEEKPE
jgi:hypothetical protein